MLVADTTALVETARLTHGLLPTACAALGRALTGSLLLAAQLKSPDLSLTLGIYGDGPLGSVVCVANARGDVKGYVAHPETHLPTRPDGKLDVGGAVGKGRLVVLREAEEGPPYTGQVLLQSGEIADDIAWYLVTSEGMPSLLALGVGVTPEGVACSAGVLIQPMPGCSEQVLHELELCAPLLNAVSSAMADLGSTDAFARYTTTGLDIERIGENSVRFACACSHEAIERVLLAMGRKELHALIEEDGKAEVCCQFCREAYRFTREQLLALLWRADADQGGKRTDET